MSDQPYTPAPEQPVSDPAGQPAPEQVPTQPAPEQPATPAPSTPAQADQDKVKAADEQPKASSLKVGQIVGYTDEELGFDIARHGIVVELETDEDGKQHARVVPLPGAFHVPVDKLTAQD